MFDKRLLDRMQTVGRRQALNRFDVASFILSCEGQAGVDALTVDQYGAGSASALITAFLRSSEPEMIAQSIE